MAAFVSNTTGAASRSVTVPAGTDRLLVAVALYGSTNAAQSATYGGVAMSVASNANGFVQIFYMLNPPAGSATLAVTGSSVDTVVAAHYTGVGSFQSPGQQASAASASFSPNAGGVIVFGMEASSTSHTPLSGTNERVDSAGTYYGDRIVTGSGSVTVGVSTATSPDYAGAIFLDSVNASGTPTAPSPAGSGSASAGTSASGTPTAPVATASGSVDIIVSASGTPSAPHPTASGTPAVVVSASGAVTAPSPTAVGSESLAPVSVSGAVSALLPSALGGAVRLGGIQCDHPRPKLDLPGYTPPRIAWQPPAYLPPSLEGLQRAVKEGFQGIYNELMKAAARRNIVPLVDDINAREGQVITGVGDGQTILMPPATPGQLGQVSVILTDVKSPVTVVNPDGSTLTLDQPGTYPISTGPGENAWQPAPGVSSSGSAGGAGYFVDAAHASLPNARVGTTSTEILVDITVPNVVSFALQTASVVFAKLQNLTGLSLLGRASNSAGAMAALTATGGGQYFRSNAGGTALEVADPASTSIVNTTGQLQRAALTGAVTASQNSNATAFGALAAKSVLANATNASAVPAALAGTAAFQHVRINSANNAVEWSVLTTGDFPANSVPLTAFPTEGADTFLGNITGSTATTAAVAFSSIASTSLVYDATSHTFQRAALTGFAAASQNGNATTSAEPIVTYSASANMSAERVTTSSTSVTVDTGTTGQILFKRAALTGEVTASADSNATVIARGTDFNASPWTGPHSFVGSLVEFSALFIQDGVCSASFSTSQNNYNPSGFSAASIVRLTATVPSLTISGFVASFNGERKIIINVGAEAFTLLNENTGSTAGNRILHNVDSFQIGPNDAVEIWKDGTSARWRCLHTAIAS